MTQKNTGHMAGAKTNKHLTRFNVKITKEEQEGSRPQGNEEWLQTKEN